MAGHELHRLRVYTSVTLPVFMAGQFLEENVADEGHKPGTCRPPVAHMRYVVSAAPQVHIFLLKPRSKHNVSE